MKLLYFKKAFFIFLILFSGIINAQKNCQLKNYLEQNSRPLVLTDTNYYFAEIMKNKNLFVIGEGGSHDLVLQNKLRVFLINQFAPQHLKYFFREMSRSRGIILNNYFSSKFEDPFKNLDEDYKFEMASTKKTIQQYPSIKVIGIDMEWAHNYYFSIKQLANKLTLNEINSNRFLKASLIDTSIFKVINNDYFKQQNKFLHYFKDTLISLFNTDPSNLKNLVGLENFLSIKYILQNNQLKGPTQNRNPGMAKNLLEEIIPLNENNTYLLSTGIYHSMKNNKGFFVSKLDKSIILKNKIVVMNVFCDDCEIDGKKLTDKPLRFMKKKNLELFRSLAKTDLTIFDVSKLPRKYKKIKKYGELILFAKQQH